MGKWLWSFQEEGDRLWILVIGIKCGEAWANWTFIVRRPQASFLLEIK